MDIELRAVGDGRLRLRWAGGPVTIRVPVRSGFELAGAEVLEGRAGEGAMTIQTCAACETWLHVASVDGRGRWITDRVVGLAGAVNLRDLGGYRSSDGRRIRWGRLFRSNRLDRLGEADLARAARLGIRVVCDLRSAEERSLEVSRWPSPAPKRLESAKPDNRGTRERLMGGVPAEAEVVARMTAFYAELPLRFAAEYRALYAALAAGETPLLFHCTAGKDRTGVAAAILLDLLGIDRGQIVQDYVLTDELLGAERQARLARSALGGDDRDIFATLSAGARLAVWRADPRYVEAALAAVRERFGSSVNYLRHLGLPAAAAEDLRNHLLAPEGEEHF